MARPSLESLQQLNKVLPGANRRDSWYNALTGIGTSRDKSKATRFKFSGRILQPEYLDLLYAESDIVQTVVGAIVQDALREGFELRQVGEENQDQDAAREAKQKCDDFRVGELAEEAATWGRLYGRGGLLLVVKGAGLSEAPLGEGGELLDLVVVDKRELTPRTYYQDPLAPKFGTPDTYFLNITAAAGAAVQQVLVHETRLVLFGGVLTPKRLKNFNEGADLSVLQATLEVIMKSEGNFDAMCAMVSDMSQGVIKMEGLIEAIAAGKVDELAARIQLMDQMRSVVRAVLLDAETEDFKYVERAAMSGIGDIIDKTWARLAKAADMPVTRFMGISPGGMNATGESDRTFWYDRVRAYQRKMLKPAMDRLVKLIAGAQWEVHFPDLEKQDPLEMAQIQTATATTDKTYIDAGVLTPSEVAVARFGRGVWSPGYDGIDMEAHEAALEKELDDLANPPELDPSLQPGDPNSPSAGPVAGGSGAGQDPGTGAKADPGSENDPPPAKGGSA